MREKGTENTPLSTIGTYAQVTTSNTSNYWLGDVKSGLQTNLQGKGNVTFDIPAAEVYNTATNEVISEIPSLRYEYYNTSANAIPRPNLNITINKLFYGDQRVALAFSVAPKDFGMVESYDILLTKRQSTHPATLYEDEINPETGVNGAIVVASVSAPAEPAMLNSRVQDVPEEDPAVDAPRNFYISKTAAELGESNLYPADVAENRRGYALFARYKLKGFDKPFYGSMKYQLFQQDMVTGIESVETDTNVPAEYYNLQGVRVENPTNGIYIVRKGSKTYKQIFR